MIPVLYTPGLCEGAMKQNRLIALVLLVFIPSAFAQNEDRTFKVDARSALVWDKDFRGDSGSSVVWDPLTGREMHKLSRGGIEVSSRMGYERVALGNVGKLLNYTTTIANNTDSDVIVRYGGASVDGHAAQLLWVALSRKGFKKRVRNDVWELNKMHCFRTGFASMENFFSGDTLSKVFTVRAQTAMTISAVSKDPRTHSVLCSVNGCQITGTIRYYVTVNGKDYVFVWPGPSVFYCVE
jgi:hypothetical protein